MSLTRLARNTVSNPKFKAGDYIKYQMFDENEYTVELVDKVDYEVTTDDYTIHTTLVYATYRGTKEDGPKQTFSYMENLDCISLYNEYKVIKQVKDWLEDQ